MAMKQWTTDQDGLDNLQLASTERPVPVEGEILVKINAVALNYRDTEGETGLNLLYLRHANEMYSGDGVVRSPQ